MVTGVRYRVAGVLGVVLVVVAAMSAANHPTLQYALTTYVPVVNKLPADPARGRELVLETIIAVVVVVGALVPLFKPRPQRILDVLFLTQKRVFVGSFALATIGYYDYTYRVPRPTLILLTLVLLGGLPAWFVVIRNHPTKTERAVVVGDDPERIEAVLSAIDVPVVGCVFPPSPYYGESESDAGITATTIADGGGGTHELDDVPFLGGMSRLDDVLVEQHVDTAVLAFSRTDRAEFFGTLEACYEHGIAAKVHRQHTDSVLTSVTTGSDELVDVDLEPWDWQDYVFKRAFDVSFSAVGLVGFAPVIAAIVVAIKLDGPGSVLYRQERTAEFGETFHVYKFRSMTPGAEAETGPRLSEEDDGGVDPRVTRVGGVLRRTCLDEIPQLWSVLVGDMSVVGPRPERPEFDRDIETGVVQWRKRWFVKPGLTGLAQVNGATGHDPGRKLRYDVEYIRRQSFWFDLKIVVRQVWTVLVDVKNSVRNPPRSRR